MKTIFTILCLVGMAFGQGTQLNGPVTVIPPKGGSPTFELELIPASPGFPCIAAVQGFYAICGQNNAITVDFGDGNGFVNLKGAKGDQGIPGTNGLPATIALGTVATVPPGNPAAMTNSGTSQNAIFNFWIPQGAQGIQGNPGPAWSLTGKTFSITCAPGGRGVPRFTVSGCTIIQQ